MDHITYLDQQSIDYTVINERCVSIAHQIYGLVLPTNGKLFDESFHLIIDITDECDFYIFCFGGVWYYLPAVNTNQSALRRLRYVGKRNSILKDNSFLGIRGGYELLNGVHIYEEWMRKAIFLGLPVLGICEKNTLAGVIKFQDNCKQNNIRPIIGATYTVYDQVRDYKYDVKCYVIDEMGWYNLLMINKEVNVINHKFIIERRFLDLLQGLVIVLDPKSISKENVPVSLSYHPYVFYQLDTVIYDQDERDREYLLNLKSFVNSLLRPISITDAFYLDAEDAHLKSKLNQISGSFEHVSHNQYFKARDEYFQEVDSLFRNEDRSLDVFQRAVNNEQQLVDLCQFTVVQRQKHLPTYPLSPEEQLLFDSSEELFWHLISVGIEKKVPASKRELYLQRIEQEVDVIELGGFIDYFLILADIVGWSRRNNILTGIGRGSAGGSLIAYLLDITHLDPLHFDLLFERFLNKGRVEGGVLPDIDCDFAGSYREQVKLYIERRYGNNQVCSIGTYTTMKIKAAIKDLARLYHLPPQDVNRITTILDDEDESLQSIFINATENKHVLNFLQDNVELINDALLLLKQPRSASIHACAIVITPDEKDLFHWLPVKKVMLDQENTCLVSEWEGEAVESIGLLKEDILGLRQLDKIQHTVETVKKDRNIDIDIYTLGYEDERVFQYFRKGWTQDIFHFGAKGLTGYCKRNQPENIYDLIAAIALYRPGPIESDLHNKYIERKRGESEIEYLWGTEEITRETYGILCYQEQIMRTCVEVGGFTLVESDDVRRGMGKKKRAVIDSYKDRFLQGAVEKGCPLPKAEDLWLTMEKFASYAFNKSHAAAYAITGYICQYLKVHYPLEFWSASFEYLDEQKREEYIPRYISEIRKAGDIKISSVDINKSGLSVHSDKMTNTIYWALSSVKQIGAIATDQILQNRQTDGQYFSFEEFVARHTFKGSKINKTHIENLIYAGAFDEIEKIDIVTKRADLIRKYYALRKDKIDNNLFIKAGDLIYEEWWWSLQQKYLSNIAFFDYESLTDHYLTKGEPYMHVDRLQEITTSYPIAFGGYIVECIERTGKKGMYCSILLESNYEFVWVSIMPSHYKIWSQKLNLADSAGSLLLLSGIVINDTYKHENIIRLGDTSELLLLHI